MQIKTKCGENEISIIGSASADSSPNYREKTTKADGWHVSSIVKQN